MKGQGYLLDTCICAYWLRDKYDVKYRVNDIGMGCESLEKETLILAL